MHASQCRISFYSEKDGLIRKHACPTEHTWVHVLVCSGLGYGGAQIGRENGRILTLPFVPCAIMYSHAYPRARKWWCRKSGGKDQAQGGGCAHSDSVIK